MAFGVGNTGKIFEDFTNALNEIFGGSRTPGLLNKGGDGLFDASFGGSLVEDTENWTGNALVSNGVNARKLRYGFTILDSKQVKSGGRGPFAAELFSTFFLDIPPQAITQREIFGNISMYFEIDVSI